MGRIATSLLLTLGVAAAPAAEYTPRYFSARPGALAEAKSRLAAGDAALQPAFQALLAAADQALKIQPGSVTQKTRLAPSGDPHDYASTAPYFWPDPTKPGGVPYVRKDGRVYPGSRTDESDYQRLEAMGRTVSTLALAYWFSANEAYADHAARWLRVWFLDPRTRMNPHLNYGQSVPGVNTGRPAGLIEGGNLVSAGAAAELLAGSPAWPAADAAALRHWLGRYLDWLRTSELGRQVRDGHNNHASLHDTHVVNLALILGQTELARTVAEAAKQKRIAAQIEPDGKQPHELGRTKSFSYSRLNLRALCTLATLAEHVGVDLWRYETADGRSLRKAIDFLVPYLANPPAKWPYEQITKFEAAEFAPILRAAAQALPEPAYEAIIAGMRGVEADRFQLLAPP